MPSAPGYVRDYKQERKTELARGGRRKHTLRLRARRMAVKAGMVKPHDGKDVDHKVPLSKGGSNALSNLAADDASQNRSYPRTKTGKMKSARD